MGVIDFKTFDVGTVSLQGSNLVEASAGTGKTYSIAILALRLILEKEIPLKEILMVTFTNDAVAELQIRIRKFVREAYRYSIKDSPIENDDIKTLVDNKGKLKSQELLNEAVRQLDETSILTIHSFCLNTLTEFAFETGQGYNLKLLEDLSDVREDEVKDFCRKEISLINKESLKIILEKTYSQYGANGNATYPYISNNAFSDVLKEQLSNKKFNSDIEIDYQRVYNDVNLIHKDLISFVQSNKLEFENKLINSKGTGLHNKAKEDFLLKLNTDAFLFVKSINANNTKAIDQIFPNEKTYFRESFDKINKNRIAAIETLFNKLIKNSHGVIKKHLNKKNQVSYDDLIENLHQSLVVNNNDGLKKILRDRYKAAFVDEFQDTDKFQFEIFNTVFNNEENILFYIGDPKQSIYGWRKADINTYFNARSAVGNKYTMNTNYRSTKPLINGLNEIFSETDYQGDHSKGVGLFCNEKESSEEKKITYHNVNASNEVEKKICYLSETEETPVTIYNENNNKKQIRTKVINLIQSLIKNGKLKDGYENEQIKASHIAILVRKGFDGKELKEDLNKLGIPSVLIDDTKIFSAEETKDILYILQAIQEASSSSLHKALLSKLTGYTRADIEKLNLNFHMTRFKKYQELFNSKGIYACLLAFYKDYQTRKNLLGSYDSVEKSGLKSYSNLLQLAEALQRIQKERGYELTGLISFLKKAIEGEEIQGDEYEQRIESDEEAVQITTIHKSKGLQYDIVIAPYLDLEVESKDAFSSFRNQEGDYCFEPNYNKPEVNNEDFIIQNEQENRRLIYVALTRAKYQLYLFTQDNGSLGSILKNKQNSEFLKIKTYEHQEEELVPENQFIDNLVFAEPEKKFDLKDKNWYKMSFSFFNLPHAPVQKTFNNTNEGYDYFIFKELERGKHIGNLLHTIFEYIDFTNPEHWQKTIDLNLKKYIPKKQDLYRPKIDDFLNQVLDTYIHTPGNNAFKLKQISNSKRINELEFDINISDMNLAKLYDLQTESVQFSFRNVDLNGILNGLIDLFFEHDNKYYILDWKSNYLGDSLEDYTPEKLNDAMNESNYHLQYYIYTMAAKRFLESKLDNFDYEKQFGGVIYLFLRGIRTDSDTGVFTTKLSLETVEKIEEVFCLSKATLA